MTQTAELRTWQFESHSGKETIAVGHRIAAMLVPPKFLILRGDLGAGKTTLVKGIAEALDAAEPDEVTSPTFTLIHEYEGTRSVDGRREPVILYHLDLYRIQNERQLDSLGLDDLSSPDSLVLVEWGEKFPSVLKRSQGEIEMRTTGGDSRSITFSLKD
ncbi:MAG TPA: tRNA (adenosine(37)-N6)-threonylcarbamoyltransferase complex ATPase subunit type 1 TsaE [Acidobacteriaceae bacterium]|jgi:tRNA threonylcarbamoyladenosine biosynthesis protein TsaE|nr:tRNA (adenosine(37)-N6)-threonylcarbamoyltransferase complex ATPase subunit type 1 TsaE [Acidobacteriaceae bacterium]